MKYEIVEEAIFLKRENRFIAWVELGEVPIRVHVSNTGRLRELLVPRRRVLLAKAAQTKTRKTEYSLIAVEKDDRWFHIHSAAANHLVAEYLYAAPVLKGFGKVRSYRREVKKGTSRFDFYVVGGEAAGYIEVKGVTLEENGMARFPDAPTLRGTRHIDELTQIAAKGEGAMVWFVIQTDGVFAFSPNHETDPAFAAALCRAEQAGVDLYAMDTKIDGAEMHLSRPVAVRLDAPLAMRQAREADLSIIETMIYGAKQSLAKDGVDQWQGKEPGRETLRTDICRGACYVFCEEGEDPVATAALCLGEEPTYHVIDGAWANARPYLTVHRMAVSPAKKGHGIGRRALDAIKAFAISKGLSEVRIDTHRDNFRMRNLIETSGFRHCGTIRVGDGTERIAYQWSRP